MPERSELEGMRNLIGEGDAPLTFGQGQRKRDRLGDDKDQPSPSKASTAPPRQPQGKRAIQTERASDDRSEPIATPIQQKAPEEMSEEEMRAVRGEPVQTTIYLWPDQKKHLALRKVHGRGDISEQVRAMLDRVGACDDQWAR